jgi:hypothetical protein
MTAVASSFAPKFAGIAITPDDEGYDQARAIWNGTADVRPADSVWGGWKECEHRGFLLVRQ